MKFENFKDPASKVISSLASLIKVAIMSKIPSSSSSIGKGRELVILGNGPSLRETIDKHFDKLVTLDMMAVNFAALAPEFTSLRPRYYMLADGHFFNAVSSDNNVKNLWKNLSQVSWDLTLFVPVKFRHLVAPLLMDAPSLKTRWFNLTPIEGFSGLKYSLFRSGLGMPRPRNVLIPAIMEGIRMGYSTIYLCGADHTWTKTLHVDDENYVVSIQPHFYKDNEEEHKRVRETYKGLHLHDVLGSMTVAFRSYWEIAEYAKKQGVRILNASPGSMIDAFPRIKEPF